jgi:phosphopantetheine adenylyltransferase
MDFKSFKQFVEEQAGKHVVITFGRFNPPTVGHAKLLDKVATVAKSLKADYKIYPSQSSDPKKNPLDYKEKIKVMRKMFPKHARNIIEDKDVKMILNALVKLYKTGKYTDVTVVVGADRISEFENLTQNYNGVETRTGFYEFDSINVVSAGERDPDAEGVEGMSASKMRKAAVDNDFKSFEMGLPKGYKDGLKLFNLLRKKMGIKEERKHIQLEPVSDIRERYIKGEVFNIGDKAITSSGAEITIKERGANFVVEEDGHRFFINTLKPIE